MCVCVCVGATPVFGSLRDAGFRKLSGSQHPGSGPYANVTGLHHTSGNGGMNSGPNVVSGPNVRSGVAGMADDIDDIMGMSPDLPNSKGPGMASAGFKMFMDRQFAAAVGNAGGVGVGGASANGALGAIAASTQPPRTQ